MQGAAVWGRVLVGVLAGVKVPGGKLISSRGLQLELLSVGGCEVIGLRVEVQRAGDGEGGDDLRWRGRGLNVKQRRVLWGFGAGSPQET